MGRAKLEMKLINKEKSRNTTYKKRKEGLIRKLQEFTTLCAVDACMIIYGPHGAAEPEIFPQNPDQVRRIIHSYKAKKDSGIKSYGIADFFHEREKKIEEELAKLRRKNMEAKYPTKPQLLDIATADELRDFVVVLSNKLEIVKSKIESLRNKQAVVGSLRSNGSQSHGGSSMFEVMNHHHHHFHQHQHQHHPLEMKVPFVDHHKSMMMLLMDDRPSTSANMQRQVFFDPAASRPLLTRYYAPPLPAPQSYMLSELVPPQLLLSNLDTFQEGFIPYEMKNETPSNQT